MPKTAPPTRKQVFTLNAPEARRVELVGDFTNWSSQPIQLQRAKDGTWRTSVDLSPGIHQYRFLVDGCWCDDPDCQQFEENPFGSRNAVRQTA